ALFESKPAPSRLGCSGLRHGGLDLLGSEDWRAAQLLQGRRINRDKFPRRGRRRFKINYSCTHGLNVRRGFHCTSESTVAPMAHKTSRYCDQRLWEHAKRLHWLA